MSSLRDKYKATSTAKLKSKIAEENAMIGSGDRAGYLTIDEGTNKFRIYPAHNPDSGDWYFMVTKHWITIEDDKGKEARRTVYNARIHGGYKKDIFEEYISMAKTHLVDNEDEDASEKIGILTDSYKGGLVASPTWVVYADKVKKDSKSFGLLEMNKSTRDGLNKIGTFEEEDEPIGTEPFTDPDDGVPVIVEYNSKAKKAGDKYSVTLGSKPKAMPLSDEDLEEFDKVKPLSQMYRGIYTIDDLTLALEGIRYFDEKHEIGLWETDEWQEKIEEITAMVKAGKKASKDKGKDSDKSKSSKGVDFKKKLAKKPVDDDEDEEDEDEEEEEEKPKKKAKKTDKFDDMDRDELKEFISEEELNELGLKVMKSDSDDEIREKIREFMKKKEASADEEEDESEEEEEEDETPKKKVSSTKKVVSKKDDDDDDDDYDDDSDDGDDSDDVSLDAIKAKIKSKKK